MTIRAVDGKFRLVSKKGKNLGTFNTRAEAEAREKQVRFFKNINKSSGGKGSLRSKVRNKGLLKG